MRAICLSLLLALVTSESIGCDDCSRNNWKCVGEGDFCTGSPGTVNQCNFASCPICSDNSMICYQQQCRKRDVEEDGACCYDGDNSCSIGFCQEGFTCTLRQSANSPTCIANAELANLEGTWAGADEEFTIDPSSGTEMCLGNLEARSGVCRFVDGTSDTVVENGCIEDNDCPFGYFCPNEVPLDGAPRVCELNYQKDLNQLPSGFSKIEGAPCQLGSMQCGTDFRCSRAWPADPQNTTAICKKRFSGKLNDYCSDPVDCASGLYCQLEDPFALYGYCENIPPCAGAESFYCDDGRSQSALVYACLGPSYDTARGDQYCVPNGNVFNPYLTQYYRIAADWARCMGNIKNSCPGNINDGMFTDVFWSKCSRDNGCADAAISALISNDYFSTSCGQLKSVRAPQAARRKSSAPRRLDVSKVSILLMVLVAMMLNLN